MHRQENDIVLRRKIVYKTEAAGTMEEGCYSTCGLALM